MSALMQEFEQWEKQQSAAQAPSLMKEFEAQERKQNVAGIPRREDFEREADTPWKALKMYGERREALDKLTPEDRAANQDWSENFLGGLVGRGKDILYNLSGKLAVNPEVDEDIARVRGESKQRYGAEMATPAGQVGGVVAEELALLPLSGIGKGLQAGKHVLTGTKNATTKLGRAIQARSPVAQGRKAQEAVDKISGHIKSADAGIEAANKEAKRIQDRLLGRKVDDPMSWLSEQRRKRAKEAATGVPDLRDVEKFERNFAGDLVNAWDNADRLGKDMKLFKQGAEKALGREKIKLHAAKNSAARRPTELAAGMLGSHAARGAAEGAAGAALLAEEGDSLEAALYGGLIGGGLGGTSDIGSPAAKSAISTISAPRKALGRILAVKADAANKNWNKFLTDRTIPGGGIRQVNPKLSNIFSQKLINTLAGGEADLSTWTRKIADHHDLSKKDRVELSSLLRNYVASVGGAELAEGEKEE